MFWSMHWLAKSRKQEAGTVEDYRSFWQQSLDRLADYLKKIQREDKRNGRTK